MVWERQVLQICSAGDAMCISRGATFWSRCWDRTLGVRTLYLTDTQSKAYHFAVGCNRTKSTVARLYQRVHGRSCTLQVCHRGRWFHSITPWLALWRLGQARLCQVRAPGPAAGDRDVQPLLKAPLRSILCCCRRIEAGK